MTSQLVLAGALGFLCAATGQNLAAQTSPAQPAPALGNASGQLPPGWAAAAAAARNGNLAPSKPSSVQPSAMVPTASSPVSSATPADKPPDPATVSFHAGLLTIHATNSSLTQILADTAAQTGMQLEGNPEDERVFGDFGPAPVDKVLGQLLDGGSSNYLLFGRNENQAPRSLVITPRASLAPGAALAAAAASPVQVNNDDDDDDDAPAPQAPLRPMMTGHEQKPGFVPAGNAPIRTPQQILDDMQRRRLEQQGNPQNAPE